MFGIVTYMVRVITTVFNRAGNAPRPLRHPEKVHRLPDIAVNHVQVSARMIFSTFA